MNAVPMFFFISGFLFFLRKDTYVNKLKSRYRSLFIPYVLWILWGFTIPFVLQCVLGLEHMFTGNRLKFISDFTISDYFRMFWDIREGAPILSTFWFLRDLIVLIFLTPIFAFLIRKFKIWYVIVVTFVYIFLPFNISGLSSTGIWYFTVGAYCSLKCYNIFRKLNSINMYSIFVCWVVGFVLTILCYSYSFHYSFIVRLFNILNSIMIYTCLYRLSLKFTLRWLVKLAVASFFIYAFHEPFMGYMIALVFKYLSPNGMILYLLPFLFVVFTVALSYVAFLTLQRIAPKFLNIITGARAK